MTVPDRIRDELSSTDDIDGNTIRDISVYQNEYEDSFEFTRVAEADLGKRERQIWKLRHDLFKIVSCSDDYEFRIARQFRAIDNNSTQGLHQGHDRRIVVHRDVLSEPSTFLGVLLHELAHTRTPFPDQTREFENVLTDLLGEVGQAAVNKR